MDPKGKIEILRMTQSTVTADLNEITELTHEFSGGHARYRIMRYTINGAGQIEKTRMESFYSPDDDGTRYLDKVLGNGNPVLGAKVREPWVDAAREHHLARKS